MPAGLEVLGGPRGLIVFVKHTEMRYFHGALLKAVLTQVGQTASYALGSRGTGRGRD